MIRINLLGQARPKAAKQAVPLEATLQIVLFIAAVAVAAVILSVIYFRQKSDLDAINKRIAALRAEKAELDTLDAYLKALCERADLAARAALLAAGYHCHKRGEWRRRREQDGDASSNRPEGA